MLKLRLPLLIFLTCSILFAAGLFVFTNAQGLTPMPAQSTGATSYEAFSFWISLIVQIAVLITLLVSFTWYVWRGKSNDQLKQNNAELKEALELEEKQNAKLKVAIVEYEAEVKRLEHREERLRKANLRLQGIEGDE
jgi:H+/gluconate symporter-like permease